MSTGPRPRAGLRKFLPLVLLLLGWSPAGAALASGDFTCDPVWSLTHATRDDCSNLAFLAPGNDSRINLQMLILDRRGTAPAPSAADKDAPPDQALFTLEDFSAAAQAMISGRPVKAPDDSAAADSDMADGEGGRCISNSLGTDAFVAALKDARGLPEAERAALAKARNDLVPTCNGGARDRVAAENLSVKSAAGRQFASYLAGAAAFYDADFDEARKRFAVLGVGGQPWVKEAARYMLGRVELNRAQIHAFDDFESQPNPVKADTASLAAAEAGFRAYLHDYPDGDYAISAQGLLRRVYWLKGDTQRLSSEYAGAIADAQSDPTDLAGSDLAQEVDSKLLAKADPSAIRDIAAIKDPVLLAVLDLVRMRRHEPVEPDPLEPPPAPPAPAVSVAELEAQRPLFAKDPALFDYLLAAHHLYVEHDPAPALALSPVSGAGPNLAFSRQVLRGLALEQAKNPSARVLWIQLHASARQRFQKGAAELALAMNYERTGALGLAFEPASPVTNADMRDILLRHAAGPDLLRARARAADATEQERRVALYVLLYKEVTRARYPDFLRDLALLPPASPAKPAGDDAQPFPPPDAPQPDLTDFTWSGGGPNAEEGYLCPPLRDVARMLGRAAHDPHALMCLGEFLRERGPGNELDVQPPADQLGGAPSQFPGVGATRLEIYKQVIADPKAPASERAYALYRAVKCYESNGVNHCDGVDVPQSQRKQWFKALKSTYASSGWASALKYYW